MDFTEVLIMAGQLILALSILVFIHELGHFMAAKAFGIKVEKFFIFFDIGGAKLFSFQWGETEYGMGWLPLGGYVKIVGMIDESMDKEQLKEPSKEWEFRSKPNWQKFIVMVAGVVMNVILGILIYSYVLHTFHKEFRTVESVNEQGIYAQATGHEYGLRTGDKLVSVGGKEFERYEDYEALARLSFGTKIVVNRNGQDTTVVVPRDYFNKMRAGFRLFEPFNEVHVGSVVKGEDTVRLAHLAGMLPKDQIYSIQGKEIVAFAEMADSLRANAGGFVDITVKRGDEFVDLYSAVNPSGKLGFTARTVFTNTDSTAYTVGSAFRYGAGDAWGMLIFNARAIGKLFTGQLPFHGSVESPIGIARLYGPNWDWGRFWSLTALLSMVLAFMNILPIPALDGGHIMFILIETISGRKLSDEFLEKAQLVGMVLILGLMVFAFGSDIVEIFE